MWRWDKIIAMKKTLVFIIVNLLVSCIAKKDVVQDNSIISQKRREKNELQLVLKSVTSDSRCPEETNCIWAGEVTIEIQVVENLKILETKSLTVSSKNLKENISWFSKYYLYQKIKTIQVLHYPKNEVVLNPSAYFVKVLFE